jgi:hypothetical protein
MGCGEKGQEPAQGNDKDGWQYAYSAAPHHVIFPAVGVLVAWVQ